MPLPALVSSRVALWTAAVRDSFVVLLPLTFFGVVATLLGHFPVPAVQAWLVQRFGGHWAAATEGVMQATYGVYGLALSIALAMQLARRLPVTEGRDHLPPHWAGLSALINFMLCVSAGGEPALAALGQGSLLLGVVVGIATPELLRPAASLPWLQRLAIGYDSDLIFYHATRLAVPLVLVGLALGAVAVALHGLPPLATPGLATLPARIHAWIDADWLLTPALVLVNQGLWFVSIHGGKVLDGHAQALFNVAGEPYDPSLAWRPMIDAFVHLGGSGATLGLLIALSIVAREGAHRRIAQLSWLPSLFNINELLMFGLPLVLNPRFLVPFMLAPLALALLALVAAHSGLVTLLPAQVPWTTPPLLSGWLLTGSWRGAVLQALGLLLSALIYLPWVRRAEVQRQASQRQAFNAASAAIVSEGRTREPSMRRGDQVGLIARGLFVDLSRSIGTPALVLAYQPQHELGGGVAGVEALLRWTHPRHGAVRADLAVTLAEEGGLIQRLGAWVLEEACACKAQWNALGLGRIGMAVNVSPLQLADAQFVDRLADCLRRYRLAPPELEIEITESQAIPDDVLVAATLQRLDALGIRLAMDDFGMGHSSLLHMRRFSVQVIKIDGSLSRDVLVNATSADIVRSITTLARARGARVVAEFVETAVQRDRLAALGCDVFQGYLYSPPLHAAACVAHLLRHAEAGVPERPPTPRAADAALAPAAR